MLADIFAEEVFTFSNDRLILRVQSEYPCCNSVIGKVLVILFTTCIEKTLLFLDWRNQLVVMGIWRVSFCYFQTSAHHRNFRDYTNLKGISEDGDCEG